MSCNVPYSITNCSLSNLRIICSRGSNCYPSFNRCNCDNCYDLCSSINNKDQCKEVCPFNSLKETIVDLGVQDYGLLIEIFGAIVLALMIVSVVFILCKKRDKIVKLFDPCFLRPAVQVQDNSYYNLNDTMIHTA